MLKWIWNYGYERQLTKVKSGSMLPLLDVETYNAIAQDNSDAGCSGIRRAKASFEDKNLALGVYYMLEGFQFRMPLLHRDPNLEKWHVDFKGTPFRSLRIQPTTDHGIVAMYAFDQKIGSFKILDFPARGPYVGDLVSRQRMIAWIWDYGNKHLEGRVKSKAAQRSQPKAPTKTHAKVRRIEKPLLHRVLHTASFKAQRGASSNIQGTRTVPKKGDITMKDVGAGAHRENVEPSARKAPLRVADPNAQLGMAWQTKGRGHFRRQQYLKSIISKLSDWA